MTPQTINTTPLGHLYAIRETSTPDAPHYDPHRDREVVRIPVLKKTPKRVYYQHPDRHRPRIGYVDRTELETNGKIAAPLGYGFGGWLSPQGDLYLDPPDLTPPAPAPDIKELHRQMCDAHPDRGGTNEDFRAARHQYEKARART